MVRRGKRKMPTDIGGLGRLPDEFLTAHCLTRRLAGEAGIAKQQGPAVSTPKGSCRAAQSRVPDPERLGRSLALPRQRPAQFFNSFRPVDGCKGRRFVTSQPIIPR